MNKYICYTDGSYQANRNTGGWSSIICSEDGHIIDELFQGYKNTTNNRMELKGVLETLKYFKEPSNIIIYSDSMYVVNSIKNGWIRKWFLNNDFEKQNLDICFEILNYLDFHNVEMIWVKGHSDNVLNNRADKLAQFAAQCLNLPKDEYYNISEEDRKSLVSKFRTREPLPSETGSKIGKITYSLG